ncbi:MAG: hypothetical protein QM501_03535 [Gimesia sp.]
MSTTLYALAIAAAIGANPAFPTVEPAADPAATTGAYGVTRFTTDANYPMTNSGVTGGIFGDQLYPFDSQHPWQHGYFQEISPYSGYHFFRPYNYRHVLSQTQTAAGWGIVPQLSYSQHFWNRYQEQATWKNYALPPREEDIEKIQQRKREYQEQREQKSSSYYQPQTSMVPVQYQSPQQPAQQQQFQQQQFQQQQQYRSQPQQYQQRIQQQPVQQPTTQLPYPAVTPRFNQRPRY